MMNGGYLQPPPLVSSPLLPPQLGAVVPPQPRKMRKPALRLALINKSGSLSYIWSERHYILNVSIRITKMYHVMNKKTRANAVP